MLGQNKRVLTSGRAGEAQEDLRRVSYGRERWYIQWEIADLCEGCRGDNFGGEGRGGIVLRVCKTTLGKRLRGNNTGLNNLLI